MKQYQDIFMQTGCLSREEIEKYLANSLPPEEKYKVEKHLVDCEMCSDALDGLSMIPGRNNVSVITEELNKKIRNRVKERKGNMIFLRTYRTQLAIAASIIVITSIVGILRYNMSVNNVENISSERIFAEKFEPYQPKSESNADTHAVIQQTVKKPENGITAKSRVEPVRKTTRSKSFNTKQYSQTPASENNNLAPIPVDSKPASSGNTSDDNNTKDRSDKQAFQESSLPPTSSAGIPGKTRFAKLQDKASGNGTLKEEEQKQLSKKGGVLKSESNAEKKVLKTKMAQPEMNSAPASVTAAVAQQESGEVTSDSLPAYSITGDSKAYSAMGKYEQKNYSGAAADFGKILENDPNNYNALFYSSVSYLGTGEIDKAIVNLKKLLENKNGEFYDAGQWYLSLAYIKKNDSQNARRILMELREKFNSKYQKQADETLKEMDK